MSKNIVKIEYIDSDTSNWVEFPFLRPINRRKTEDGTLDIATISSRKTTDGIPIEPFTKFRVETINGNHINWYLNVDKPEQLTKAPRTIYHRHEISLVEPTKILERTIIKGFSITQPLTGTQTKIDEAIDLLLDKEKTMFDGESPRYTLDSNTRGRISHIISPELTFNDLTLRECLDIMFSYTKAITRIKEFGIISADFLEDFTEISDFGTFIAGEKEQDVENYCDALVTSLQNIVSEAGGESETTMVYPCTETWITPRAPEGSTEVSDTSAEVVVNNPFYKMKKVFMRCEADNCFEDIDITDYVYEKTAYLALPEKYQGDPNIPYRGSAIFWEAGSNRIKGLTYNAPGWAGIPSPTEAIRNVYFLAVAAIGGQASVANDVDIKDFHFRVEYIPLTQEFAKVRRLDKEKFNTSAEIVYNQTEKVINTDSFGENAKLKLAQLGNPVINRTYTITDFNKMPDIGNTIDGLYVNDISIEDWENYSKATVELVENYSKLKDIVAVNKEYRISDIPDENLVDEQLYVEDFCVIGFNDAGDNTSRVTDWGIKIYAKLFETYSQPNELLASSSIITYPAESTNPLEDEYLVSTIARPYANTLLFSQRMVDNVSAGRGNREELSAGVATDNDVIYVDPADTSANIDLVSIKIGNVYEFPNADFKNYGSEFTALANSIPKQVETLVEDSDTGEHLSFVRLVFFDLEKMVLKKDARGILAITYQIHPSRTDKRIKVGSNFAKNNPLVNLTNNNTIKVYGLTTPPKEFLNNINLVDAQFDLMANNVTVEILEDAQSNARGFKVHAVYDEPRVLTYAAYCYADSITGEVLLTINKGVFQAFTKTDDLYFNFKKER